MACYVILLLLAAVGVSSPAIAQTRLTLTDAIARARSNNLDARAAAGAEREAGARVSQVRGSYLPKVDLVESWQRGDQPVFVFSSLLAQRQFTAANFAIDALNHPQATNNFRTAITLDQAIYSPSTSASLRTARIGHAIAGKQRVVLNQALAVDVADAYGRVLVAMASRQAAAAGVAAAMADREVAGNRRDAGRATDADVLQVDVYLARIRAHEIRADADGRLARATLNELMGFSLDSNFELEVARPNARAAPADVASLEAQALADRPELPIAALQEQMAFAARDAARAAFLPEVSAQAVWEF